MKMQVRPLSASQLIKNQHMKKLLFIGDTHGKIFEYQKIVEQSDCDMSFCVGDFGWLKYWEYHKKHIGYPHYINPGNHDAVEAMQDDSGFLSTGNHKYFEEYDLFTVRGAYSIDKQMRTERVDWFREEELNYVQSLQAILAYERVCPQIVVSHDCPQEVREKLFGIQDKSHTSQLLQEMFDYCRPELWIFGHHHKSKDVVINGTRFICLAELETFKLNYG